VSLRPSAVHKDHGCGWYYSTEDSGFDMLPPLACTGDSLDSGNNFNQNYKSLTKDANTCLSNPYYHTSGVVERCKSPEADAAGTNENMEAIIEDLQEADFEISRDPEVVKDDGRLAGEIRR